MLWNWSKIPIIITKTGHQRSQYIVRPQNPHLHRSQTTWKLPARQELTLSEALSSPSLPSRQALISRPEASSKSQLLTSEHTRWFYIKHQLCVLKNSGFSFYSVTQHVALEERLCDCWNELCHKSKGNRANLSPKPEIGASILGDRWRLPSTPDTLTAHPRVYVTSKQPTGRFFPRLPSDSDPCPTQSTVAEDTKMEKTVERRPLNKKGWVFVWNRKFKNNIMARVKTEQRDCSMKKIKFKIEKLVENRNVKLLIRTS